MSDQPLNIQVEGGLLLISIGIDRLSFCSVIENGGPLENHTIVDDAQWAKDVARELEREEENGNTPLNLLLDKAIRNARDMGSAALSTKGKPKKCPFPGGYKALTKFAHRYGRK